MFSVDDSQFLMKSENFKDFESNMPTDAALDVRNWMSLCYRIYGNMLDNTEFSFVVSFPQIVSQLSFLMSVCPKQTTGLQSEFSWSPTTRGFAHKIMHKNLMESTELFMTRWKKEMIDAAKPGKIKSARRALCYPKYAISFHLNTLECLRRYLVEWVMFDGTGSHQQWIGRQLGINYKDQVVINVWPDELLAKDEQHAHKKPLGRHVKPDDDEMGKRAPILAWISHAQVAIHPEIFDSQYLYTSKKIDYIRIAATPTMKIQEKPSQLPWNMIILPCAKPDLCFIIIYDFSRNLCTYDDLRLHVNDYRPFAPCIVRRCMKRAGEEAPSTKKNIYFPYWNETEFYPNKYTESLQKVVKMEDTFTKGGFDDLACSSAQPSAGVGDIYKMGHLQNFATMSFFNVASSKKPSADGKGAKNSINEIIERHVDNEVVPHPFCAILWDTNRQVPVFMGKITGKKLVEEQEPEKPGFVGSIIKWLKWDT
ncbi:Aminotran_5 domain-containing protein [Caenorhabditis elegans]|uniref:Aminotran_5 domain-containing protein n=1 Tax=Caenorhabditis elegans TaxID=6239 RepID=G5EDL8_CAEEL|nr:Aminotran_5 domain-containing protein [Caenorhabditis elegans]CAC35858.1 Aminotran_5 domain-containing protein [Caenorhabditis elegans]|eukprot:NP_499502.1 Uncharacterized protein CELE_Y66A7A.4 [Caenorhabditis elegans]